MMTINKDINHWDIVRWMEANGYRQYRDWVFKCNYTGLSSNGPYSVIGIEFEDPAVEMQVKLIWY